MARQEQPPPPPIATVEIPFTLTIKGNLTVPAGTQTDLIKASVMGQISLSASMATLVNTIDVQTGAPGLAVVRG